MTQVSPIGTSATESLFLLLRPNDELAYRGARRLLQHQNSANE
jgi:hypothetical protein